MPTWIRRDFLQRLVVSMCRSHGYPSFLDEFSSLGVDFKYAVDCVRAQALATMVVEQFPSADVSVVDHLDQFWQTMATIELELRTNSSCQRIRPFLVDEPLRYNNAPKLTIRPTVDIDVVAAVQVPMVDINNRRSSTANVSLSISSVSLVQHTLCSSTHINYTVQDFLRIVGSCEDGLFLVSLYVNWNAISSSTIVNFCKLFKE